MHSVTMPLTQLMHANFSLIMAHAFSQPVIRKILSTRFQGEWKYLWKSCVDISEQRVAQALFEFATQLRTFDDDQHMSDYLKNTTKSGLGSVSQADGTTTDLFLRDLTNKILHSAKFEWDFTDICNPKVVCFPSDPKRWRKAEIDVVSLAGLCGSIMF